MHPLDWITCDDTGISSEAMWTVMMGRTPETRWKSLGNHPHDPDDFGRCHRLLLRFPQWRKRLPEMGKLNKVWKALIKHWDELTTMYEAEVGKGLDRVWGRAPKMYDRMRQIIDKAEGKP